MAIVDFKPPAPLLAKALRKVQATTAEVEQRQRELTQARGDRYRSLGEMEDLLIDYARRAGIGSQLHEEAQASLVRVFVERLRFPVHTPRSLADVLQELEAFADHPRWRADAGGYGPYGLLHCTLDAQPLQGFFVPYTADMGTVVLDDGKTLVCAVHESRTKGAEASCYLVFGEEQRHMVCLYDDLTTWLENWHWYRPCECGGDGTDYCIGRDHTPQLDELITRQSEAWEAVLMYHPGEHPLLGVDVIATAESMRAGWTL